MKGDASGRDARMGSESPQQSWEAEHQHWKSGILNYVTYQLDAILAHVKNGASVSAARRQGMLHISLRLATLASAIRKEDGARNVSANSLSLTARQGEIILLLDMGMKPKEIARQLTLSEATVRTHIRNARRILDSKVALEGKQS